MSILKGKSMRIDLSVEHWLNIVCVLVLLPLSSLALSNYSTLDRPAALALIDENGHAEIPNNYTSIGADAFKQSDLKSVTIPDGITNIGDNAFSSTQLTSIEIPNSVVTIEQYAFAWTYSLTSLTLGNSLQTIEGSAFYNSGIINLILPDSVTSIGSYSFYGSGLESLTIGNSLTSISSYAFGESNDLQDLVIGSSVTSVGNNSFNNTNITSLVIPESVTHIYEDAFRYVPIGNLVIGSNVTSIGDDAFSGVNGDVFILKPAQENFDIYNFSSMANIYACDSLDDAGVPQGCEDAYPNSSFTILDRPAALALIDENGHAEIPNNYTSIGADAFKQSDLKSVTIPDGITNIGDNAFSSTQLTSIEIPNSVVTIEQYAFAWTYSLTSLTLGNSLQTIEGSAFYNSGIINLILPDSVTSIGSYSFYGSGLESLTIGNSLTSISSYAFGESNDLQDLVIGSSVTSVGNNSFNNTNITSLVIPESVTHIYEDAFRYVPIGNLVIGSNVTSIGDDAFSGVNGDVFILKPAQENFDIYNFSSMANIYACDSLDDAGVPQGCEDAWPDDGIDVPEWPINVCDSDPSLPECDPCTDDSVSCIGYGPGAFGGAIVSETDSISFSEGGVFIFPSGAEWWAGFAISGISSGTYPLSFMEAGSITFTGYISEGGSADIRFQLQFQEHPNVEPTYDTATVTVSGAMPTSYTVEIPSQGDNTFSSLIMYLETVDVAVTITDVVVSSDADSVDSNTPNNQIIKVTNTPKGILGNAAVLEVSYDTGDSNNQLTGIGMRVHFNSSLISFKEITNLVEQDIIVNGQGPFNDEDDFDNDPLTDQYISFGWASLFGNWPNAELPAVLMNIAFDVADTIDTDTTASTNINFSHTALASGYQFESESYNLQLQAASWDFDGNGQADALTDGLMMLRYYFGLRGDSVTLSAMATDSPLSSDEVVAEIEAAHDIADIDDDGKVEALTDALMLLRYLFGLEGEMITNQAVGQNANRSSHEAIQAYIEGYMPAM
jgi:hypothetical protein